jgi:hypothetical protein
MSRARQIVVVIYGLSVALCFLRIPWTNDVGYSWLWTRPQPVSVNDIVAEARQRWRTEYEANTSERIASGLAQEIVNAPANPSHTETKEELAAAQLRANRVGLKAKWRRDEMTKRQAMSDDGIISWLREPTPPRLKVQRAKVIVTEAGVKRLIVCESCNEEKYIAEGESVCDECESHGGKVRGKRKRKGKP